MTAKETFVEDLKAELYLQQLPSEVIDKTIAVVILKLGEYDMSFGERELIVYDDQDTIMIQKFFISKSIQGLSKNSLVFYKAILRSFFNSINKHIVDITGDDVTLFLMKGKIAGWKDTTLNNNRRTLNSFFGWCFENELIEKNPMTRIKGIREKKHVEKALTENEMETVRLAASTLREKALVEVLYSTGCRCSELTSMNRSAVNWEKGEIEVLGKGGKYRTCFFSTRALFALKTYIDSRTDNDDALFYTDLSGWNGDNSLVTPGRLTNSGIRSILSKLGKKTGIHLHPHLFRKTVATQALHRGMPIEQIQKMLGHTNIETTLIYAQSMDEDLRTAHQKFI